MKLPTFVVAALATSVFAADLEPFVNEPDTGLEDYLRTTGWVPGQQPLLEDMRAVLDFDFAARQTLGPQQYAFYRVAAAGEWSYRNNLNVWSKARFRTRHLTDVSKVNKTMETTFLGYKFSAPFFIAPAARAILGHERGELNFVDASAAENILHIPSIFASKSIEEIGAQKALYNGTLNGPLVGFQQIYGNRNLSVIWSNIARAEAQNMKAIVFTVDAPGDSTRHRAARYDTTNANSGGNALTWDLFDQIVARTKLPVIIKGITTVEDAQLAVEKGAKGIYISNHGGRQLEYSPSPLETAYEIYRNAPEVFQQVEVMADSGVRYGSDVIKLLALGVKMVGLGRPFMYANTYGVEGVRRLMQIMKAEIVGDAAQAGVADLRNVSSKILNFKELESSVFLTTNGY
ncbi:hypothetical protein LZ554_000628 [Drepanopeziza brunnea f. sp. 'monogermtubi']|nr:hypothetical protein LZ554_000628 [Drepanopeziza brunnea f. sp. 'monogermtubi']